jgi:uncharacterized protein (TIGR03435 family)
MIIRLLLTTIDNNNRSSTKRSVEPIAGHQIGRTMHRPWKIALCLLVAALITLAGRAMRVSAQQNQPALPPSLGTVVKFEVASVKVNKSGKLAMPSGTRGRTYRATNVPLRYLIATAYRTPAARVLGGPAWVGAANIDTRFIGGDRFDISASLPEGTSAGQVPLMLRALLADRFKLTAHTEVRDAPVYALGVARNDGRLGPHLRKAPIDCEASVAVFSAPDNAAAAGPELKPEEQDRCRLQVGGEILGRGQRLSTLARTLSLFADLPVVDRTGLVGGFDFDFQFPELETAPDAAGPRSEAASGIYAALREQLGLKLQSARGNLEFVVIDSVAHPTEN